MSSTRRIQRTIRRSTTAVGVAGGIAGLTLATPLAASAATSDPTPQVVNRETVAAKLDSTGKLDSAHLFNQLTVLGNGKVTVLDPTSGKGLRDLDGFSTPLVRDGKAQYTIDVDGRADRRTVADFTGQLPVTLKAEYKLNGKAVSAKDVVGKSGTLETTYTVVNTTSTPTPISYKNGKGETVDETVDLVTPYVGTLAIALPQGFRNVRAAGSDAGGDGRGGTNLSWSLVLFHPLGQVAQQLSWKADVTDAELPPASLQVVPVSAEGNTVLPTGTQTYSDSATAAASLTSGAYKIDDNVVKLRDGARQILDGLTQLSDGAHALNDGLATSAVPGAKELSAGLSSASTGGAQLDSGLAQLLSGASQLADGASAANTGGVALSGGLEELLAGGSKFAAGLGSADAGGAQLAEGLRSTTGQPDLSGGAAQVAAGLVSVRDGVAALAGVTGLPAAKLGLQQLLYGLDHAPTTEDPAGGLLQGLSAIAAGLSHTPGAAGATDPGGVKEGLAAVLSSDVAHPGLPVALAGVKASEQDLTTKLAAGGSLDQLVAGAHGVAAGASALCAAVAGFATSTDQVVVQTAAGLKAQICDPVSLTQPGLVAGSAGVAAGVASVKTSTQESLTSLKGLDAGLTSAVGGLTLIKGGVDRLAVGSAAARDGVKDQLEPGVQKLLKGVTDAVTGIQGQLAPGVDSLATGADTLATKLGQAADGAAALRGGLDQLNAGGGQLVDGAGKASAGADALSSGLGKLATGTSQLEDGAAKAKDGSGQLSSGLGQLDAGGKQLASGLQDASDGSAKVANGVDTVKDAVGQVADGANQLSGQGTSLLAGSADTAATDAAKQTAELQAMADKAKDGALPYGAPAGAFGDAAYSYTLAGANSQSSENTTRGAAALGLLALGSLSGFVLRRRATR